MSLRRIIVVDHSNIDSRFFGLRKAMSFRPNTNLYMSNNKTLTELSHKLRLIADELEHCAKTDTTEDIPPKAGEIPTDTAPEAAAEPAHEAAILPPDQSVAERILARVQNDDQTQHRNVACCAKIPSSLALRLRMLFAANATIKKGDWYTGMLQRHLARCEGKTRKELFMLLQHVQSREREPKTYFVSSELHARLRSFLARHDVSLTRFVCSALQREIQECERINNGPFLV
jgi:hypothetical protein